MPREGLADRSAREQSVVADLLRGCAHGSRHPRGPRAAGMNRAGVQLAALATGVLTSALVAGSHPTWPASMGSTEFVSPDAAARAHVIAWMDGYSKKGLRPTEVGEVDVGRDVAALLVRCAPHPSRPLRQVVADGMPAGTARLRPTAITCGQFTRLDRRLQRDVASWLDGYHARAGGGAIEGAIADCRRAPSAVRLEPLARGVPERAPDHPLRRRRSRR